MTTPDPLDYEPRQRPAHRDRRASAAAIALALGALSLLWAIVALLLPSPPVAGEVRSMLLAGCVPSALIGLAIAAIRARGRLRTPALVANGLALATSAWVFAITRW